MTSEVKIKWDGDGVCLVTGGAGFIGSHLVRELVSLGREVVVLDNTSDFSYIADCIDKVTYIYGDVSDMPHLMKIMENHNVAHVFHLAYMLVPDTDNRLATAIQVNCGGFHNVMEAARLMKVERVVWASTQSVYGFAKSYPPGPVSEDVFVDPVTLYGACKLFNEHIARHYKSVYGLDNIGFRKSVVYGLGKSRRRDLSIAHLLIENALLGQPISMPPVDYHANYVYVKDIVRAYLLAMQAPPTEHIIFNIGGYVFQNSEVVALLKKLCPDVVVHQQKAYDLPHPIEVYDQTLDYARDELGYEPAYSLEDGIQDYIRVKATLGHQYESAWTELNVTSLL